MTLKELNKIFSFNDLDLIVFEWINDNVRETKYYFRNIKDDMYEFSYYDYHFELYNDYEVYLLSTVTQDFPRLEIIDPCDYEKVIDKLGAIPKIPDDEEIPF